MKKPNIETQNQKHWHDYFNTGTANPDAPEYIQKAGRIIDFVNLTEEERTVARSLERAQADYDLEMYSSYVYGKEDGKAEGKAEGIVEGRAEGIVEGIAEGIAETARLMLREGLQPEIVAKCTQLPLESVMAMC